MAKRWCTSCGQAFEPRPQAPRQLYCSTKACQQSRKRLWQKTKRKTDHDYHQNQERAQERWRSRNTDYWRNYRAAHPEYAASNRTQQRSRNAKRSNKIANSDASPLRFPTRGIFRLTAIDPDHWGEEREWIVELAVIARYPESGW